MKFEIMQYADISTGYLEGSDLELISDRGCPMHIAEEDDGRGSFFYVSDDEEIFGENIARARTFGLSERFISIMRELHRQKVPYVRFDSDGSCIRDDSGECLPFAAEEKTQ